MVHNIRTRERKAGLHDNTHASKIIKIAKRCEWCKLNTNRAAVESLRRVAREVKWMPMRPEVKEGIIRFIAKEKQHFGYDR